jgi:hypothetical protein
MHAKYKNGGRIIPRFPDTPTGAAARAKVLPQWMYRDPAEVAQRLESIESRAETRSRVLQLEREREIAIARHTLLERMAAGLRRIVFAPPEIRMRRARIQALTRAALKERK